MKMQYLGDAKDNFKWDYHNYLTAKLGYDLLNVVLMLNPDDDSGEGKTHPANFSGGNPRITDFCICLRKKQQQASQRVFQSLYQLPKATHQSYTVKLNYGGVKSADFLEGKNQVVLIDPDTGFQPSEKATSKHVRFCEIGAALCKISDDSIVSVFQDLIRKNAENEYRRIKNNLPDGSCSTAIRWQRKVMFVIIAKSPTLLDKVCEFNGKYCNIRDSVVELLDNDAACDKNKTKKDKNASG